MNSFAPKSGCREMPQNCPVCGASKFQAAEGFDFCFDCCRQSQLSQERTLAEFKQDAGLEFYTRKKALIGSGRKSIYGRLGLTEPKKIDDANSATPVQEGTESQFGDSVEETIRQITGAVPDVNRKWNKETPSGKKRAAASGTTQTKRRRKLVEVVQLKRIVATEAGKEIDRILTSTKTLKRIGGIVKNLLGLKDTFLKRLLDLWMRYVSVFDLPTAPTSDETKSTTEGSKEKLVPKTRNSVVISVSVWLSLLFVAAREDGADVLFSDLIRWMREGRLDIFDEEIKFTFSSTVERNNAKIKHMDPTLAESLSYTARTLQYVCDLTGAPSNTVLFDFDKILARLLLNLNLPSDPKSLGGYNLFLHQRRAF